MQDLISLSGELKTLLAVADEAKMLLPQGKAALDKVLAVLAAPDLIKPASISALLTDVDALLSDCEKIASDENVKAFLSGVVKLVENIRNGNKVPITFSTPAST